MGPLVMSRLARLILRVATMLACLAPIKLVAETLTIGTMNQGIRTQMKIYEPFAAHIEREMRGTEIKSVRLMVVPNADQMADAIRRNEVDIFIDSPLVAGKVARMSGAQPFLRRLQQGSRAHYSVIIARKDSGISTVADLEGKTIAFTEPDSCVGYLLPAHIIVKNGLGLREIMSREQLARPGEVNFRFSSHEKNTIYQIATDRVDAAAVSLDSLLSLREARPGEYRIVASSSQFPRQVLLYRDNMDANILSDLRAILLAMPETEEGRNVLRKLENTSGFEDFPKGPNPLFARINMILDDLSAAGIK